MSVYLASSASSSSSSSSISILPEPRIKTDQSAKFELDIYQEKIWDASGELLFAKVEEQILMDFFMEAFEILPMSTSGGGGGGSSDDDDEFATPTSFSEVFSTPMVAKNFRRDPVLSPIEFKHNPRTTYLISPIKNSADKSSAAAAVKVRLFWSLAFLIAPAVYNKDKSKTD